MNNEIQFILYQLPDEEGRVQVVIKDETIWATKILNEYIRKGFVLDDERLKQGTAVFGKDYFQELLERVRSIRASERRMDQSINRWVISPYSSILLSRRKGHQRRTCSERCMSISTMMLSSSVADAS